MTQRVALTFRGRVQGVGFRWFVRETAQRLGVRGWVRNRYNGSVDAEAEAEPDVLERFIAEVRDTHPYAKVEELRRDAIPPQGTKEPFEIR